MGCDVVKASVLPEPELEFHAGTRHIDPRHGITDYGPADATSDSPRSIRVGIVGPPKSIEGVRRWLDSCRRPIAAKPSHLSNLFFAFPGFDLSAGYRSQLVFDSRLERPVRDRELTSLASLAPDVAVRQAVDLYLAELDLLNEEPACDVVLVARPDHLPEPARAPGQHMSSTTPDFHALLKAATLLHSRPIQMIRRSTWDPSFRDPDEQARSRQDPATSAWNLHTALYYKAGGVPWRLPRAVEDLTACFVGVSFYRPPDADDVLQTSVAQVFNQRGDGMIVRGGPAKVSRDDRQPHLSEDDAHQLLVDSLNRYRSEHRTMPARVVLHKSSSYTPQEVAGFRAAADELSLDQVDMLWIGGAASPRLFRPGAHPPLRGTLLSVDEQIHSLYTRGSVPFYGTYPGMYVPVPLAVRVVESELSPDTLCEEVLALTKMNWNQTQLDTRMPITLETARRVGNILRCAPADLNPATRYAFYM